jgi:hypothetical protein
MEAGLTSARRHSQQRHRHGLDHSLHDRRLLADQAVRPAAGPDRRTLAMACGHVLMFLNFAYRLPTPLTLAAMFVPTAPSR